jgi:hypothetical protein
MEQSGTPEGCCFYESFYARLEKLGGGVHIAQGVGTRFHLPSAYQLASANEENFAVGIH